MEEEITKQDFLESYTFSKLVPKIARYRKRDFFAYGNFGKRKVNTPYLSQNYQKNRRLVHLKT